MPTYTGESLNILGSISVMVDYKNQKEKLHLLIVEGDGPSLIGRDWLQNLRLEWNYLNNEKSTSNDFEGDSQQT